MTDILKRACEEVSWSRYLKMRGEKEKDREGEGVMV